jgi:predicted TIM-barrel fold metal-dependent hydrolase
VLLPIGIHNLFGESCPIYSSNEYISQLCHKYPNSFIPFASTNLRDQNVEKKVNELYDRGFVGMKYHTLEGYDLRSCKKGLKILEELNLPIVVHTGDTPFPDTNLNYSDPRNLIEIAQNFPKLRIMITHFATPLHNEAFYLAARYENIYLDTAEYPIYWEDSPMNPFGGLLSPLRTKRIGISKIIFGTDFPMPTFNHIKNKIEITIHDTNQYIESLLDLSEYYFSPEEKKQILTQNIWQFLGKKKSDIIQNNQKM